MAGLYGELEIALSYGASLQPPVFLNNNTILYVSGNVINTLHLDVEATPHAPFAANAPITALAAHGRENVLAFAERHSSDIRVLRVPQFTPIATGHLKGLPDHGIVSLAFSYDGCKLFALGDQPNFTVSVWDWKKNLLLCSCANGVPARTISVNPLNMHQICTSGEGTAKFWWLKEGYKKFSLKAKTMTETALQARNVGEDPMQHTPRLFPQQTSNFDPQKVFSRLRGVPHIWTVQNQVIGVTSDSLLIIDASTGLSFPIEIGLLDEPNDADKGIFNFTNITAVLVGKDSLIVASKDGYVRFLSLLEGTSNNTFVVKKSLQVHESSGIFALSFSTDYLQLVALCDDGSVLSIHAQEHTITRHVTPHTGKIVDIDAFRRLNLIVTASEQGQLRIWNTETRQVVADHFVPGKISTVGSSPLTSLLAIGSHLGVVRLVQVVEQGTALKLIARLKLHHASVTQFAFDPLGKYLISAAADESRVALLDTHSTFAPMGYLNLKGNFVQVQFQSVDDEKEGEFVYVYILATVPQEHQSFIHRFALPLNGKLPLPGSQQGSFTKEQVRHVIYKLDNLLSSIQLVPSHLVGGREAFYAATQDRSLKLYYLPTKKGILEDKLSDFIPIPSTNVMGEFDGHEKYGAKICMARSREWLITFGPDGKATLRSLVEPDKAVQISAHDSYVGGVISLTVSKDSKVIYTVGHDQLIRFWEWRYTTAGKKAAAEAVADEQNLAESQKEVAALLNERLEQAPIVKEDFQDGENEQMVVFANNSQSGATSRVESRASGNLLFRQTIENKLQALRQKLSNAIEKNSKVNDLERLESHEFVIDFEARDRLLTAANARVEQVKHDIEQENIKKRILFSRIKRECWDSMEINGKSIKSFHPHPLTNKRVVLTNYPIRKPTEEELSTIQKVRLMRRTQIFVSNNGIMHDGYDDDTAENDHDNKNENAPIDAAAKEDKDLLYHHFDLTSIERKKCQIVLLESIVYTLKKDFNRKFEELLYAKQDVLAKIEEKNERIKEILAELQINEEMFKATLDMDEIPEKVITVQDSEVTVEKFISPEEQKRIQAAREAEEQRRLASQEDNSHERALMVMMGGRLEDKAEKQEKEELIRPEWMNKNKNDMNEEEKKLVKEFEKKVAQQKEEQEKHRKALETELKKLQTHIIEICVAFDQRLQTFLQSKLVMDQVLHQYELKIIKLVQTTLYGEDDDAKESAILERLHELKQEKAACVSEIPEIKKDLEHCREDYELALKREKELDKIFKKEFHVYDFYYDTLWRLFKKRDTNSSLANANNANRPIQQSNQQQKPNTPGHNTEPETLNPYEAADKTIASLDESPLPLNIDADLPDGLSLDIWNKLIDLRDRKIACEQEVRATYRKFQEMQNLVAVVLQDSERIRAETDYLNAEYQEFLEYKFLSTYNLESLFEVKQGQVEVPQAPVVTDYADAVLIHRATVERLNEVIMQLGHAKVEALREMKEYRKGIHALEWENKVLDFQAENLLNRTRDIQLLRVTKQMQEFIRSGDEHKQPAEVATLEKRMEHSQKTHEHKLEDKKRTAFKIEKKIHEKQQANKALDEQLAVLETTVAEREHIYQLQSVHSTQTGTNKNFKEVHARRRLLDCIQAQRQDLEILRRELERLQLKTYPTFAVRTHGPHSKFGGAPAPAPPYTPHVAPLDVTVRDYMDDHRDRLPPLKGKATALVAHNAPSSPAQQQQ